MSSPSASEKKTLIVFGSTGSQGSSVAKFLLDDGTFHVKAVTRDPSKPAAKALVEKGAEVVTADLNDPESLKKALTGAYGVFGMTNWWDPAVGSAVEPTQGRNLVDACKATGIKHFVWSTLDHTPWKPDHWETKAQINDYLLESGVPRTSLYTGYFNENIVNFFTLSKAGEEGKYKYDSLAATTDAKFIVYSVSDTGAWVLHAFKHPSEWIGKDMRVSTERISLREIGQVLSKELGVGEVPVPEISEEEHEKKKPMGKEMYDNMMSLFAMKDSPTERDITWSVKVYPQAQTFEQYVRENKEKILAAAK